MTRPRVDVAINVFGKPNQTALTLLSLLRHSGHHIARIFFVENRVATLTQRVQRFFSSRGMRSYGAIRSGSQASLLAALGERAIFFVPRHFLWLHPLDAGRLRDEEYRHSLRYQYAWERSEQDFLFITHNDCVYRKDVVGALLDAIPGFLGAGAVGQCWNCPAGWIGTCTSAAYESYRPDLAELRTIYADSAPPPKHRMRPYHIPDFLPTLRANPWPLPECRLNEWCALIDLGRARGVTAPLGPAVPFGAYWGDKRSTLDLGVEWFRQMCHGGFRFRHVALEPFMEHLVGHAAIFDVDRYEATEGYALEVLRREYARESAGLKLSEARASG